MVMEKESVTYLISSAISEDDRNKKQKKRKMFFTGYSNAQFKEELYFHHFYGEMQIQGFDF